MDGKEIDGFQIRVDFSITDSAHKLVLKFYRNTFDPMIVLFQANTRGVFPPWKSHPAKWAGETRVQRQRGF